MKEERIDGNVVVTMSEKEYENFIKVIDMNNWWEKISLTSLSEDFIERNFDKLRLDYVTKQSALSEGFIRLHVGDFRFCPDCWGNIFAYQDISEDFIEEFKSNAVWICISNRKLSEDFIRRHSKDLCWHYVCRYNQLSENFIREVAHKVDWTEISCSQSLSEEFIREFSDKVSWFYISRYQVLSEDFIREFKDKVDWHCISEYQLLSESFIREFYDNIDWGQLGRNQKIPSETLGVFVKEIIGAFKEMLEDED